MNYRSNKHHPQSQPVSMERMFEAFDMLCAFDVVTYVAPSAEPGKSWIVGVPDGEPLRLNRQQAEFFVIGALTSNLAAAKSLAQLAPQTPIAKRA